MVLKGKIRSNGSQLANYLSRQADNDNIPYVLDVRGTAQPENLKKSLIEMDVSGWTTRTKKTLYHAQINPDIAASQQMTREQWIKAADLLEKELGFQGQRRVLVMHTKDERVHCHAVWSREKGGKVIDNRYSRLKQDKAREIIERELQHQRTPERNKQRPEIKEVLTRLWHETQTGREFIRAAAKHGLTITTGTQRPFMVIDENGRSFDLVRQIYDVRTKVVRERLAQEFKTLPTEKSVIQGIRKQHDLDRAQEKAEAGIVWQREQQIKKDQQKTYQLKMEAMLEAGQEMTKDKGDKNMTASQDKAMDMLKDFRKRERQKRKNKSNDQEQELF